MVMIEIHHSKFIIQNYLLPGFYNQSGARFMPEAQIKKVEQDGKRENNQVIKRKNHEKQFARAQHQNRVFHR